MMNESQDYTKAHDFLEKRKARIMRKNKASHLGMSQEVCSYLAGRFDIGDVEHALVRIVAYSSLVNREVSIQLVEEALRHDDGLDKSKSKLRHYRSRISHGGMAALLSGVLLLNGCSFSQGVGSPVSAEKKVETNEAEQTERAVTSSQTDITLPGLAIPFQEVMVSPPISGNVKAMMVDLGAYVKKDQPLAQIDESDLGLQVKQAETHVKTVEVQAQMQAIEQQIRLNEVKATLAQTNGMDEATSPQLMANAEAALAEAKTRLEKSTFVFEHGGIPQEELEQDKKQVQQAEQQIKALKESKAYQAEQSKKQQQATSEVAKLQKQAIEASARLTRMGKEQALADLELIRYQYNNLTVKAPITGFVTEKKVMLGDSVSPSTPLFVITNLDQLYIMVNVPEAMINKVRVGQQASVQIPTIGKGVEGKVAYVAPLGDPETQTFPVKILVENKDHHIKGGMRAQVKIMFEVKQPEPAPTPKPAPAPVKQEGKSE